jgi:hypothetical protein
VKRYSGSHETSYLRPFTLGERKRATEDRAAFLRRLRPAPSPDHPCQRPQRTRLANSPLFGLRLPDRARRHPLLQRTWPWRSGSRLSSPPSEVHAAFDEDGGAALREILHQSPRNFGIEESLWTLEYAAEVSFEQGITDRRVTGETIRATLDRLGVRWKRAKHWIESPDPEYARKKGIATG